MSRTPLTRPVVAARATLGAPVLFAVIYAAVASGIYFALGVVADHALGLTPLIFLLAAGFFGLAAMTYTEASALHPDRGGSTVFARHAFNELWSFVAGWAVILDYVILIAVCATSADHYLAAFWSPLDDDTLELVIPIVTILAVAAGTMRGFSTNRVRRLATLVVADLVLQVGLIVLGLATFFSLHTLTSPIHLGTSPRWDDVVFALGVSTVVLIGLESASGLSGEVGVGAPGLKRLVSSATLAVAVVYVGIALVALTALPVVDGRTPLGHGDLNAPVLGITRAFHERWLADGLTYVFAAAAVLTLVEAAASAMLGLSRLAYTLSRNRQIPSAVGRLHPQRGTPVVVIALAALGAIGLVIPEDLDFLVGIYAFGALLGLTIAHLSVIALRYREPEAPRRYAVPLSVSFRGGQLPLPAVLGALLAAAAWVTVLTTHHGARYVGVGWMLVGVAVYVTYRLTQGKSLYRRVSVPEKALRRDRAAEEDEGEFGSILVPLTGGPLDDDIIQTAGRLAGDIHDDFDDERGATIEALWVFEVPMSLPIDGRLPEAQLKRARAALARAKAVGEEYEGVEVATATVRARRSGQAIVEEARRRGVEAIVLAAEEPTRIRGGALLGGRSGANEFFVGEMTKYVLAKAGCQVILTVPAADVPATAVPAAGGANGAPAGAGPPGPAR